MTHWLCKYFTSHVVRLLGSESDAWLGVVYGLGENYSLRLPGKAWSIGCGAGRAGVLVRIGHSVEVIQLALSYLGHLTALTGNFHACAAGRWKTGAT